MSGKRQAIMSPILPFIVNKVLTDRIPYREANLSCTRYYILLYDRKDEVNLRKYQVLHAVASVDALALMDLAYYRYQPRQPTRW